MNRLEHLLVILAEEADEVGQRAAKALRFGLDDGPYLPGRAPRRKPPPKSPEELADIRARAWATRRARYGPAGHRGLAWGAYRR